MQNRNVRRFFDLSVWSQGINFDNECRTALLELFKNGTLQTADVSKLYNYYYNAFKKRNERNKSDTDTNSFHLLMIQTLQSEKMTSYLINVLFTSETLFVNGRSRTLKHQQNLPKYVFLFAYSVTAQFEQQKSLFSDASENTVFDENEDIDMISNDNNKNSGANNIKLIETTDETKLNGLTKKLTEICLICQDRDYGNQLSEHKNKQDLLFKSVEIDTSNMSSTQDAGITEAFSSLLAYGIFKWIYNCMMTHTSRYFDLTSEPYMTPLFISLLSKIALNHEYLRSEIVEFCVNIIAKKKNLEGMSEMAFCESVLELIAFIMQLGNYITVFENFNDPFLAQLDLSTCRILIRHIIGSIKPPLPTNFVHLFFNLINHARMIVAIRKDKNCIREVRDYYDSISKANLPHNARDIMDKIAESGY